MAKIKFRLKVVGGRVVGVAAGTELGLGINKILPKVDPLWTGLGKIVLGAVIPEFIPKKGKESFVSSMVDSAGIGLMASGVVDLNKKWLPDMVSGVGKVDNALGDIEELDEDYRVNGSEYVEIDNDENINGVDNNNDNALNGPGNDELNEEF